MSDPTGRYADRTWRLSDGAANIQWDRVHLALLMDIRDELQRLNGAFVRVGPTVHQIERNTRAIRCSCGRGPYLTAKGLERHINRMHAK